MCRLCSTSFSHYLSRTLRKLVLLVYFAFVCEGKRLFIYCSAIYPDFTVCALLVEIPVDSSNCW